MTPAERAQALRERLAAHARKVNTDASISEQQPKSDVPDNVQAVAVSPAVQSDDSRVTTTDSIGGIEKAEHALSVSTDIQLSVASVLPTELAGPSEPSTDEPPTNLDLTNPAHAAFIQNLTKLDEALAARDPQMPLHLASIHKALIEYDEIVPLLTPEEIGRIMSAQQQHVSVVLRAETAKGSKAAASRKAAKLGIDDL